MARVWPISHQPIHLGYSDWFEDGHVTHERPMRLSAGNTVGAVGSLLLWWVAKLAGSKPRTAGTEAV